MKIPRNRCANDEMTLRKKSLAQARQFDFFPLARHWRKWRSQERK
jgi:hypothetical protein